MTIGFTGTRRGMTDYQKASVHQFLRNKKPHTVHHGDCAGADEQFHDIARSLGIRIEVHPPKDDSWAAYCQGDLQHAPRPYLQRNRDIVDASDMLLACPKTGKEQLRSGTWATVRYAEGKGIPVRAVGPRDLLRR